MAKKVPRQVPVPGPTFAPPVLGGGQFPKNTPVTGGPLSPPRKAKNPFWKRLRGG